jgi:hypothetical protein
MLPIALPVSSATGMPPNPFSPHRESANFWVLHRRLDEEAHIFETENIGSEFIRP